MQNILLERCKMVDPVTSLHRISITYSIRLLTFRQEVVFELLDAVNGRFILRCVGE